MRIKYTLTLIAAACSLSLVGKWCIKQTDGFQITRITSSLPPEACWDVPTPTVEQECLLDKALEQPFTYLAKGGQAYAFVSQDNTVVLKLFKMHRFHQYKSLYHVKIPGWMDVWRVRLLYLQKRKLKRAFNGSTLAYTLLRDETGLLYLNLNPNQKFKRRFVTLVDKLGISHRVSLEHIPFSLQMKVDKAFPTIASRLTEHDVEGAKRIVKEMFTYFKTRRDKCLIDLDGALRRNIGVSQGKVVSIDIGGFVLAEPAQCQTHFFADIGRMRKNLSRISPELPLYLDTLLSESNTL